MLSDGTEIELTAVAYAYEQSPLMERVVKTVTAAGSRQEQTSVEETYGEAAAYPYAAGQMKFTRDIAGVETSYDYEAAAEYGAAHKKTAITKAGGVLVAGQSRKTESFIAANDTVLLSRKASGMVKTGCCSQAAPMNTMKKAAARKPRGATAASAPRPGCAAASSRKRTKMVS